MIGKIRNDNAGSARDVTGYSKRQFVGLAARAGEYGRIQLIRKLARQSFGIFKNIFMQVSRVRVQCRYLFRQRLNHVWMAVTHVRHIVVHVQVFAPIGIEQPNTFSPDEVYRFVIKQFIGRSQ